MMKVCLLYTSRWGFAYFVLIIRKIQFKAKPAKADGRVKATPINGHGEAKAGKVAAWRRRGSGLLLRGLQVAAHRCV